MADPILVEFIELHAKGILDIDKELQKLKESMGAAEKTHAEFIKSLRDPAYEKKARELVDLRRKETELAQAERSRLEVFRQRASLQSRIRDVESGEFGRRLQTQAGLARLDATVREAERKAELRYRYGAFGGAAYSLNKFGDTRLAQGAMALGTSAFGMAAGAGLSDTVEGNRLAMEFQLISRELGNALKPAIDLTIKGLTSLRRTLEHMGPAAQNVLMTFMLLGAGRFAYGRLGGAVSFLAGGAGTLAARAAGGGGLGAGAGAGALAAGAAGTTLAARAAGAGAGAAGAGAGTGAAGGGAALAGGAAGATAGRAALGGMLLKGGLLGLAGAAGLAQISSPEGTGQMLQGMGFGAKTSNYLGTALQTGGVIGNVNDLLNDRRPAAMRLTGMLVSDVLGAPETGKWIGGQHMMDGAKPAETEEEKRRREQLTQNGVGFDAVGSAYERMSDTIAQNYVPSVDGEAGIGRALNDLNDTLRQLQQSLNGQTAEDENNRIMRLRGRGQ